MVVAKVTFPLFLLALQCLSLSHGQDDLTILTDKGKVRGIHIPVPGGSVSAFLGIPYAEPPVGDLRFRRPTPHKAWSGVRQVTELPNSCYQNVDVSFPGFPGAEMWNPNTRMSEDCLYLNVWAPSPKPRAAPVMVWIYGGGFSTGSASLEVYDGRFLSHAEGVVVVAPNYRLGALGFLALPGSQGVMGNAGLYDQRMALQWVANNIAAFGGDPRSVTLFGESAGAASVSFHVVSPGSHALFSRAILQSGSVNAPWAAVPLSEAWNRSLTLAGLLGCQLGSDADLEACLRGVEPEEIVSQQHSVLEEPLPVGSTFVPTVDGDFLADLPEVLIQSGQFKKTELLLGVNKDEGTYFLVYGAPGFSIEHESLIARDKLLQGVRLFLLGLSDISQEAVVFHYTDWTDEFNGEKNRDALNHIIGDYYFICPLLEFAQRFVNVGHTAFLYFFDHRSSRNAWPRWMGVMHGYEIEFVFGMPLNRSLGYTKEEEAMSRKIMKHWANFARTGNPNVPGSAAWPAFTAGTQEYISLNSDQLRTHRRLRALHCKFWDSFLPKLQDMTVSIDKVELQWKTQFHRWLSYMLDWKNQFNDYSLRKNQCGMA
ncbi:cholinesterase-like [Megalops cyprinoides]|uniref:cholinesterase-like n=1 Tax=Megalops cyprinoides TaxID=118141 RepID=UPI001863C6E7|nr:cholinesterase-like [Megalops cyprinoides]